MAKKAPPKKSRSPRRRAPGTKTRTAIRSKPSREALESPALTRDAFQKASRERACAFAVEAARMLADDRCEEVMVIEIPSATQPYDYVVLGTGSSDRQMQGTGGDVVALGASLGHICVRRNVDDRSTWVLLDFSDVIVHLFEPNTRAFYDIETLWGDAPRIEWVRPEGTPAPGRTRRAAAAE
ncbi:MAG: ribosome silencing factor [Phycisphaerales bacterium]